MIEDMLKHYMICECGMNGDFSLLHFEVDGGEVVCSVDTYNPSSRLRLDLLDILAWVYKRSQTR